MGAIQSRVSYIAILSTTMYRAWFCYSLTLLMQQDHVRAEVGFLPQFHLLKLEQADMARLVSFRLKLVFLAVPSFSIVMLFPHNIFCSSSPRISWSVVTSSRALLSLYSTALVTLTMLSYRVAAASTTSAMVGQNSFSTLGHPAVTIFVWCLRVSGHGCSLHSTASSDGRSTHSLRNMI